MRFTIEKSVKPRNPTVAELRSSKYRMRVASSKKAYNRQVEKQKHKKDSYGFGY